MASGPIIGAVVGAVVVVLFIVVFAALCCCKGGGGGGSSSANGNGNGDGNGNGAGSRQQTSVMLRSRMSLTDLKAPFCDGPSVTIKTSNDAVKVASCPTYSGSVTVDTSFSGPLELDKGLTRITGDLTCAGVQGLTTISARLLSSIDADLTVRDLPSLSSINFTNLSRVNGSLDSPDLPQLQMLSLPSLTSTGADLTVRDLSSLSSTNFTNLGRVGGALDIQDLPQLQALPLPSLANVRGDIVIVNNAQFDDIDWLPKLAQAGSPDIEGNFSSLSLPSLSEVNRGAIILATTTNTSICRFIDRLSHNGVIYGDITCSPQPTLPKHDVNGIIIGAVMDAFILLSCTNLLAEKGPRSISSREREDVADTHPVAEHDPYSYRARRDLPQ